ncbi:MAG TPA: hypothetical protein VNT79_02655 [Phycisphaerae bacterium]|nr:hypothetical protein [Phycisphaerae bacterium]
MNGIERISRTAAIAACLLFCATLGACKSKESSTSQTHSHGGAEGSAHDQHGDSMAGSDTDRAAADLEKEERERKSRPRRPALHDSRRGSRVVDQPRPTVPPPR